MDEVVCIRWRCTGGFRRRESEELASSGRDSRRSAAVTGENREEGECTNVVCVRKVFASSVIINRAAECGVERFSRVVSGRLCRRDISCCTESFHQ